jgi:hypothetical protein
MFAAKHPRSGRTFHETAGVCAAIVFLHISGTNLRQVE